MISAAGQPAEAAARVNAAYAAGTVAGVSMSDAATNGARNTAAHKVRYLVPIACSP
jgi:hypothetical protein